MTTASFNLSRLRATVKPFRLHWFPRLRSTNDHAAHLRKNDKLFAPAIVLTAHQIAGRGRGSNTWFSSRGCLTVTFALPIEEDLSPHQLPLLAGLAVRNAVAQLLADTPAPPPIQLKWPNDIWIDGRKVAGLLCERVHHVDLVGLGLNVNLDLTRAPRSLRGQITSLQTITGQSFDLSNALSTVASHLHKMATSRRDRSFSSMLHEYDRHHLLVGKDVRVIPSAADPPLLGRCEGLDNTGRLLLRSLQTNQLHPIIAGHIELIS